MKTRHIEQGKLSRQGKGLGTVTEDMVLKRAQELAVINGRTKDQVLDSDREQARRELTGEEGLNPPRTPAEKLPEDKRWQEVAPAPKHQATTVPAPDEQTVAEGLVEEGVQEAEHDQMKRATEESLKREPPE